MRFFPQAALFVATLMLGLVTVAPTAHARDRLGDPVTTTVRIDRDGILQGDFEAIREAHNTIVRAARRVCGELDSRDLTQWSSHRACVRSAVSGAVERAQLRSLSRYLAALPERERVRTHRGDPDPRMLAALEAEPFEVMFAAPPDAGILDAGIIDSGITTAASS